MLFRFQLIFSNLWSIRSRECTLIKANGIVFRLCWQFIIITQTWKRFLLFSAASIDAAGISPTRWEDWKDKENTTSMTKKTSVLSPSFSEGKNNRYISFCALPISCRCGAFNGPIMAARFLRFAKNSPGRISNDVGPSVICPLNERRIFLSLYLLQEGYSRKTLSWLVSWGQTAQEAQPLLEGG